MKDRTQGAHGAFSLQSTYFSFSLHSMSPLSAPGPLTRDSSGTCLPHSPELIQVLGYHDLFERYTGNISVLTVVYSRAIVIREIRQGAKQKFIKIRGGGEGRAHSKMQPNTFLSDDSLNPAFCCLNLIPGTWVAAMLVSVLRKSSPLTPPHFPGLSQYFHVANT